MKMSEIQLGAVYTCAKPMVIEKLIRHDKALGIPPIWTAKVLAKNLPRRSAQTGRMTQVRDGVLVECMTTRTQHVISVIKIKRDLDASVTIRQARQHYDQEVERHAERQNQVARQRHQILADIITDAGADVMALKHPDHTSLDHRTEYNFKPHELLALLRDLGVARADASMDHLVDPEPPMNPYKAENLIKQVKRTPGRRDHDFVMHMLALEALVNVAADGFASRADMIAYMKRKRPHEREHLYETAVFHMGYEDTAWFTNGLGWRITDFGRRILSMMEQA